VISFGEMDYYRVGHRRRRREREEERKGKERRGEERRGVGVDSYMRTRPSSQEAWVFDEELTDNDLKDLLHITTENFFVDKVGQSMRMTSVFRKRRKVVDVHRSKQDRISCRLGPPLSLYHSFISDKFLYSNHNKLEDDDRKEREDG